MQRTLFEADHEDYRDLVQEFVTREVAPNLERWDEAHDIDRSLWLAGGKQGIFGIAVPEEFGGGGLKDYRFRCIVAEELAKVGAASVASSFALQDDVALPYFLEFTNDEQKQRWLPGLASGELIGAVAMTEPGAGSDLQGIRTTAVRDGDDYIVNGTKTFITNGIHSDVVVTVVRTDPSAGSRGISLLVVEEGTPGFERGRKLNKVGLHSQDTAELFFNEVRVPVANLLGDEGSGFVKLMENLPTERLSIGYQGLAASRAALEWTVTYTKERTAFGKPIAAFQNSAFELADIVTELDVLEAYLDKSVLALNAGELTAVDAAKGKLWGTEVQKRVVDRCLQLYGGYGYMLEYPIARAYMDARIQTIYGGTSEIMRTIIARDLTGLR